jgi:hypothetical protein
MERVTFISNIFIVHPNRGHQSFFYEIGGACPYWCFIIKRTNNKEFDRKEQTENKESEIFTRTLKLMLRNEAILPYWGLISYFLYG